MDSATHDLLYQRISELVYDEEKIVTIISIASELKISKDEVLSLLTEFISAHDKNKSGVINVTYLLYGRLKDGKGINLCLVKEDDLQKKKCLFEEISTESIYSVQVGKEIDFNMIALTNAGCENGIGLLKSRNCIKRNIKAKKIPTVQSGPSNVTQTKSNSTKVNGSNTGSSSILTEKSKTDTVVKAKPSTQSSQKQNKSKQGGLAGFFAKASTKPQNAAKKESPKSVEKFIDTSTDKDETIEQTSVDLKVKEKNEEKWKSVSDIKDKEKTKEHNTDENSTKSDNKKEQVNSKKRKKESKNKGPNKKRKRIQQISDSDSSDIFDDDEEENEDIVDVSHEESPPPPPISTLAPVPKNKKRKAVDKTYVDDEGFIVTTTEYVYESASEEEEKEVLKKIEDKVLVEKKNEKLKPVAESKPAGRGKGNKKAPVNGKQPTLMSFFKKT